MALRQIQRRYSKFILNAFKNSSQIGLPIQQSISRSDLHTFPCKRTSILRNSSAFQKRFYFKNREYESYDEGYWFHNPKRVRFTLFFFSCGVAIAVSSGESITVPYSERSHFLLFHKFLAKILPEEHTTYDGELLPPFHPDSVRARRILLDIIHQALPFKRALEEKEKNKVYDYEDCEIIVTNSPEEEYVTTSGRFGKIYVTSGTFDYFGNNEEMIATVIWAEVGLMLAASAGYDPEVGLKYPVYGGELNQSVVLLECLSLFPSGRKRNGYLARPQILNEAIFRYRHSAKLPASTDST